MTERATVSRPHRAIRLSPADASRYARLRLRMLHDAPWSFGATPDDDLALDAERLATLLGEEHHAIMAVEAAPAGELVAAAAVVRQARRKFAHRAGIWGVFVDPHHRGGGIGREVVGAAVSVARGWRGVDWVDLRVSESAPAALRLYESLGFRAWGREPEALEHEGRRFDEIYMALRL